MAEKFMPGALSVGSTSHLEQNTDVLGGARDQFVPSSTDNTGE